MAVALVDTNVLIDYRDEESVRHERAQQIVEGIDRGELPTGRVTDFVLLETLNWIHTRRRHDLAIDTYERLHASAGFEVHHTPKTDCLEAMELFQNRERFSFGDATIVACMHRTGIEHLYSFDDDFDGVDGVTRLSTDENPFGTQPRG